MRIIISILILFAISCQSFSQRVVKPSVITRSKSKRVVSVGDSSPPFVTSASIIDATTIRVTFTENVQNVSASVSNFNWDGSSLGNDVTANGVTGSGQQYEFTFVSSWSSGETINMDYSGGTVQDDAGNSLATITDFTTVNSLGLLSFEAECSGGGVVVGSNWRIFEDPDASGSLIVQSPTVQSISSAPTDPESHLVFTFDAPTTDTYNVFARTLLASVGDDSFWIRANGGSWTLFNPGAAETVYTWHNVISFALTSGQNTITIGLRENGAIIDKIELDTDSTLPTGEGGSSVTCPNQPPSITNPGTQIESESAVISLQIVATDINSGDVLNYVAQDLPLGLSINSSSGLISGTLSASAGTYPVDVIVDDGELSDSESFDFIIQSGSPPTVVSPIENYSGTVDVFTQVTKDLNTVFDDDAGTAALTYAIESNSNTTLAPSPSIDGSDVLTVNLASGVTGTTTIIVSATDGDTNAVNDTFNITTFSAPVVSGGLKPFPSAEGFGGNEETIGGRGGTVYQVTSLSDDGSPGTLRHAIEASGPRIVIFRVGGIIQLTGTLAIDNPNITIFGQTAPGDGIYLYDDIYRLRVRTSQVVIRGLRCFIAGSTAGRDAVSVGGFPMSNVIIDHCTFGWGTDENFGMNGGGGDITDWTVQYCMIMEGQNFQNHGYGPLINSVGSSGRVQIRRGSFIKNNIANNAARYPLLGGTGTVKEIEVVNNILYNYRGVATGILGDSTTAWVQGNLYKPGGDIKNDGQNVWISNTSNPGTNAQVYQTDNLNAVQGPASVSGLTSSFVGSIPFTSSGYTPESGSSLGASTILTMGAIPHHEDIETRTYDSYVAGSAGIINSYLDVGGLPTFTGGTAPTDTDGDGLPDTYENSVIGDNTSLTPGGDNDSDGYTNIEEWANEIYGEFTPADAVDPSPATMDTPFDITHNTTVLSWSGASDNVTTNANLRYELYTRAVPGSFSLYKTTVAGDSASMLSGLSASTDYEAYVVTLDELDNSSVNSDTASWTTTAVPGTDPIFIEEFESTLSASLWDIDGDFQTLNVSSEQAYAGSNSYRSLISIASVPSNNPRMEIAFRGDEGSSGVVRYHPDGEVRTVVFAFYIPSNYVDDPNTQIVYQAKPSNDATDGSPSASLRIIGDQFEFERKTYDATSSNTTLHSSLFTISPGNWHFVAHEWQLEPESATGYHKVWIQTSGAPVSGDTPVVDVSSIKTGAYDTCCHYVKGGLYKFPWKDDANGDAEVAESSGAGVSEIRIFHDKFTIIDGVLPASSYW